MTEIAFYLDEEDKIFGFEAEGHSGFAGRGHDIVCAGISSMTTNCINSLEELLKVNVDVETNEKKGYMDVHVSDYKRDDVQLLFKSLELGLKNLSESYSKNVKLTNRRCKP